MAKRRRKTATRTRTQIVRVPAAAPVVRVVQAGIKRRVGGARRVRRTASQLGGFVSQHNLDAFTGGAMFGYAVKQGWVDKLPPIPIIGRTGTAALLADYFSKGGRSPALKKFAVAAATLAGYQLGHDGKVTGDLVTSGDSFSTAGDED